MTRAKYLVAVLLGLLLSLCYVGVTLAQGDINVEVTSPIGMSDFQLWSIITGAATTYVAAFINRTSWRSDVRFATFFVLGCIVSAGNAYWHRELDFANWSRAMLLVIGSGVTWYTLNKGAVKSFEDRTS